MQANVRKQSEVNWYFSQKKKKKKKTTTPNLVVLGVLTFNHPLPANGAKTALFKLFF
jgi:hypothetical protein